MMWKRIIAKTNEFIKNIKDPLKIESKRILYDFKDIKSLDEWQVFTDESFGGFSKATFRHQDDFARFSGKCSTKIKKDGKIKKSGFCGIRSIGSEYIDLSDFERLIFCIRGDNHTYLTNLRNADMFLRGNRDVWQAPIYCKGDNEWHEYSIPINHYILTSRGQVVEAKIEMNTSTITSIGFGFSSELADKDKQSFCLDIKWIKAATWDEFE